MEAITIIESDYKRWVEDLSKRFRQSQIKAAVSVNSEMLRFYWELGRDIVEMHIEERWGDNVIKNLSVDLQREIPDAHCFSRTNLYYTRAFYLLYSRHQKSVPQVEGKISPQGEGSIVPQVEGQMLPQVVAQLFSIPCETYSSIPQNEDIVGDDPKELQYVCKPTCIESIYLENLKSDFFLNCISSYQQASGHKETIYFTHDDHLSSASWITDRHAEPVQYIHYAPYGELLANQSLYGYDERYKFTGKERDAESGYDFYGARFFGSALGHWLSVDPLADKYPGISPYAYCNWNPIKFVDSEGTHPLVAAALAVVAPEIVAATALVGVVIYYNLTHQEERNNTSSWEGNKPFSEVRDTRVGLEWQNRQDRKAKRASELQEMEHQQFLQDNLPDPSPDPNKGKDPKGTAKQLGIGGLIAAGISYAAVFFNDYKQNTTPKVDTNNDLQAQNNENAKIEPLKE